MKATPILAKAGATTTCAKAFVDALASGPIEVIEDLSSEGPQAKVNRDMEILGDIMARDAMRPLLRVWTNRQCLVTTFRHTRAASFGVAASLLSDAGWPVVLRRTGGKTVPNAAGILNVSLFHRTSRMSPQDGYAPLVSAIADACNQFGVAVAVGEVQGSMCNGAYDLAVHGRKIAGAAGFSRRRGGVYWLVHASVLLDCDLPAALAALSRFESALGCGRTYADGEHANLSEFLTGTNLKRRGAGPSPRNVGSSGDTDRISQAQLARL
jgi:lipoate-protein ligase A